MTPEQEAEIRARVAAGKRLQPSQAHGLLAAVDRLRTEVAALRAVIAPQPDETGESFALSVRGVLATLMAEERARLRNVARLAMMEGHFGAWPISYIANRGERAGQTIDPIAEIERRIGVDDLSDDEREVLATWTTPVNTEAT